MSAISPDIRSLDLSAPAQAEVLCAHCTLPVPAGLIEDGAQHQFCCEGCRAVFTTITGCGLADYYRLRDAADVTLAPASPGRTKFDSYDTAAFETLYVNTTGNTKQTELVLEGLTCGACVWLIEKLPDVMPGLIEARLHLRDARLRLTWNADTIQLSKIASLLDRFGYTPHPAKSVSKDTLVRRRERTMIIDIGIAFALMGNLMLIAAALYAGWAGSMDASLTQFLRWIGASLGVLSLAWPGRVFFINAYRSIRNRVANLDLPIAIALVAGLVAGIINTVLDRSETYFDSLSMLVFLLLVGRYLQHRQQRRADASVELLFNLMPSTVHVWRDDVLVDLPSEALVSGDIVDVRDGELVPGDGVVVKGRSALDQSLLTGESVPVDVDAGQRVFAGAMNRGSTLTVRLSSAGRDTRVGRLMELVEQGLAEKPEAMRFADRIGRWFIPTVILAAAGTFAFWSQHSIESAVDHAIAMLIVTCPCILGLATPLTMAAAIGQLARRNVLVKSAAALERLADVQTMIFDKTGTLTRGELRVVDYVGDDTLKPTVAAMERDSQHPIARAIRRSFGEPAASRELKVTSCGNTGVKANVDGADIFVGSAALMSAAGIELPASDRASDQSKVYVALAGRWAATITLADEVRDEARQTLDSLRTQNVGTKLLSGDSVAVVDRVARQVGIDNADAVALVTPEQKLDSIRTWRQVAPVAMVGDGVNDAAALAAADVGIAVHGGAEASLSAADIYIATPGIGSVQDAYDTARHTMGVVRRNFVITLAYNLIAGILAASGVMNPLIAAIMMPLSSATTLGFAMSAVRRHARRQTRLQPRRSR